MLPLRLRQEALSLPPEDQERAEELRLRCGQPLAAVFPEGERLLGRECVTGRELEQLLELAKEKGEPPFLVLCDGVEDPHNLGAIIRSALLCGAHGVVIPKRGGAAITPTVLKSSAGAAARLPVARVANIGESIRRLKDQGVFVYCADMDGAPLHKNDLSGPVALVMGSEGRGVSPLVKKLCDGVVSLSMAARGTGVDSFNVSVAAGIILYEIARQRGQG